MSLSQTFKLTALALIGVGALQSCSERGCTDPMASNYNAAAQRDDGSCHYGFATDERKEAFAEYYAALNLAMYEDAFFQAEALRETVEQFLDNPTIPGLEACRDAWVLAHIPYSQAEVLAFPASPADDRDHRINAWQFNANLIDDGTDSNGVGIINRPDLYPEINRELLESLHQGNDGKRITMGYHVIEYLLWGKDDEHVEEQTAGNRSFKDYDTSDSTVLHASRRAAFLRMACEQLSADLAVLVNAWSPLVNGNYYKTYTAYSPGKQTRLAITGLVLFAQYTLGDHRIETTLLGEDPEREESRFSDNTHRDIYFNARGMKALFSGRYGRLDSTYVTGTSLMDVVFEQDSSTAQLLDGQMDAVQQSAGELPAPYDYHVSLEQASGMGYITDLAIALEVFGEHMTEAATQLNMGIEKDLPDQD